MASRKRPHDSTTNGLNHDMEGITIRNGSESATQPLKTYRPVSKVSY